MSNPNGNGPRDVFVSHVEEDQGLALRIANKLETIGYSTWYYERDSIPGISYLVQTGSAIERCRVFLLLISEKSLGSYQIEREIERAHEEGKRFIPVRSGISHVEFQNQNPLWRQAIGTTASIEIRGDEIDAAVDRIVVGMVRHDGPVDVSTPVPGFDGRPAIAVLAFDNMSDDPEQEYFADGIAEDILTRLAMWRWIPVIARNSSFAYKGRAVDVKVVGRELGVQYVLEGSVRKAGNRVRVTGQLIDAETGHHVWADQYDGEVGDIFTFQDEITESVVAALEPAIGKAEIRRARAKEPENLAAWEILQRANWHFHRFTQNDFAESIDLYRQSIAFDPNFSQADSMLAFAHYMRVLLFWSNDPAAEIAEMLRAAQAAWSRDDMDPIAHAALGLTNIIMRDYDAGLDRLRRSIELNPSFALGHFVLGVGLTYASRPAEGIPEIETAMRLSPNDSLLITWLTSLALSHYQLRQYENALEVATRAERIAPQYPLTHHALASALGQLGRVDEARGHLEEFLRLSPGFSYEGLVAAAPFKESADMEHLFEGIRKAGWQG